MSIRVKGFLQDVGGASRVTALRRQSIDGASPVLDPRDPIRDLADALHPRAMRFRVVSVADASPTAKTFRLESTDGHLPVFQAGQYVNFRLKIGESVLTRPYTISSAPADARGPGGYIEVTIRRNRPYLAPDWFFANALPGTELEGNMPFGTFYWEPLRDSKNILALAGGSGITPFYSMAREIALGKMGEARITILYGSVKSDDILLKEKLAELEKLTDRVKAVHVLSGEPDWPGERGFITRELIEKYEGEDPTYMFCGPLPMFRLVEKLLKEKGVGPRRFRHDVLNHPADPRQIPGWPAGNEEKTWRVAVRRGVNVTIIDAAGSEPVAVALERAGIPVDTHCRCGECGYCRSQLLKGEIFVPAFGDGRRLMDKELGWFHACSAYPVSDLEIKIPIL